MTINSARIKPLAIPKKSSQNLLEESSVLSSDPRNIKPYLHQKTHFKGAASLFIQKESSLDLGDETAREIVKEILNQTGHPPAKLSPAEMEIEIAKHRQ